MADGDYYARNLAPGWRKVANAIAGGQQLDLVVSFATKAYAETMRLSNGVPGLGMLVEAIVAAARDGDRAQWTAAGDAACRAARHHANTQIAVLEGQKLLENEGERLRTMSASALAQALAEATAQHIAAHHVERCQGAGLPESFGSVAELRALQREIRSDMPIGKLAAEMLRHEDGRGFATPRRTAPAVGTAGLIDTPLEAP